MNGAKLAEPLAGRVMGSAGNDFVVAEWRDRGAPPGPPRYIAPVHLHHHDDEGWYVLEGVLCVQRGDDVIEARAGSGVFVPRATKHTYWNPSGQPTRYLLLMTGRIYRLIQDIHALEERTPERLRTLFREYDSELLG